MLRLLSRNSTSVTAMNYIASSYADRGVKLDEADRLLHRALAIDPDDAFVLDSFGWLLFRRGDLTAAADALERADRLAPFEPEILFHLGELYLQRGDRRRAADLFQQALTLDPEGGVRKRLEERVRTLEARRP